MVIIQNHYSVISPGTEGATIRTSRSSLLQKARQKPDEAKEVLGLCWRQGPFQAYRAVAKRLDAYSPLGYSSAGQILAVGADVSEFKVGDFVAAAGVGYANHAEVISVPINLCVKLPADARLDLAAYNTLGAIALQGVRQAEAKLGETCVVIGLGLIGQLTCLMLKASGVRTFGVDVDRFAVDVAAKWSCDAAWLRSDYQVADQIELFTDGQGADAVIITAATSSTDPINFAGRIARKKARVVVVGSVPTGFERDPYWYRKELELRMSCSYGPGRYDPDYEQKGHDYPVAYVRWSERRNMAAFQQLLYSSRINISHLTTHEFPLEEAPRAYDLISKNQEPHLGVLLSYKPKTPPDARQVRVCPPSLREARVRLAFIGAGSYAQGYLLPNLPKDREVIRKAVLSHRGAESKRVAEKYRFELCLSDRDEVFRYADINTLFIATRHDSHAEYVLSGLMARKNVFVEKPLAITQEQLNRIVDVYASFQSDRTAPLLMVGYNRRFSTLATALKTEFGDGPMSMLYRVNAGRIPAQSWIHDQFIGGGRIVGEVCHFVDLLMFLCGSLPSRVHATALSEARSLQDTVNIQLTFENGSIGTIAYYTNGAKDVPKEYIEVHCAGATAFIRDFAALDIWRPAAHIRRRLWWQDKGQKAMLNSFLSAIKNGQPCPIPFEQLQRTSATTFAAKESLVSGDSVQVR